MCSITFNINVNKAYLHSICRQQRPDQPANMDSLIKVYLHVVRLFKQCKFDQSADAILYRSDGAAVHVKTESLLFEYEDKYSNGAAQIRK